MPKIEPLHGKWGARAALYDALETVSEEDTIIILFKNKDIDNELDVRTANLKTGDAYAMLEEYKFRLSNYLFGKGE